MKKEIRHRKIFELIKNNEIGTQEELTAKLIEAGCEVSQATVSRDISELNLIKIDCGNKKYKYACSIPEKLSLSPQIVSLFKQITVSIESANNLIVLKTLSGNAGTAGMAIDEMHFPQILGTVAGDDTVLIITKTTNDAEVILKSLRTI